MSFSFHTHAAPSPPLFTQRRQTKTHRGGQAGRHQPNSTQTDNINRGGQTTHQLVELLHAARDLEQGDAEPALHQAAQVTRLWIGRGVGVWGCAYVLCDVWVWVWVGVGGL